LTVLPSKFADICSKVVQDTRLLCSIKQKTLYVCTAVGMRIEDMSPVLESKLAGIKKSIKRYLWSFGTQILTIRSCTLLCHVENLNAIHVTSLKFVTLKLTYLMSKLFRIYFKLYFCYRPYFVVSF